MSENGISSIPGFAEPVASWSHLLGAIVFAVLSVPMLRRGWHGPSSGRAIVPRLARMISLGIFCFAAVALFSVSGTYHLFAPGGTARDVMLRQYFCPHIVKKPSNGCQLLPPRPLSASVSADVGLWYC